MSSFVHLHVHSHYSILDGMSTIPNLVDKAVKYGMPAIALTDHGNMFGIKEFYDYVKKHNSKTNDKIAELKGLLKDENTAEEPKDAKETKEEVPVSEEAILAFSYDGREDDTANNG